MGDMLFLRSGAPDIERYHGAYISEEDVETIVESIRTQEYRIEQMPNFNTNDDGEENNEEQAALQDGDRDDLFEEAARTIVGIGQGSTSLLQRRMKIGYARAGRLMDELEKAGIVGPPDGSKPRDVLVRPPELEELLIQLRN
jgi:S-DNA-T family DNA segregation ATPase FtsK/SpoIIIE